MHIPSSMLHGAVCPVTVVLGAAGTGLAVYCARQAEDAPSAAKFSAVTALVFALQMLNFPVQDGTSGHLLGGVLTVALLGISHAVLSMVIVLAVQAFFFGDGGVGALGANGLNMALLGAGVAGLLFERMKKTSVPRNMALALAAWASVILASMACSFEVAFSGAAAMEKVLPAMLKVHALIGIGEAFLTVAVLAAVNACGHLWRQKEKGTAWTALALAVVAVVMSPFASNLPDGLESVSAGLSFVGLNGMERPALFADYVFPGITDASLSGICAGLAGVMVVVLLSRMTGGALRSAGRTA